MRNVVGLALALAIFAVAGALALPTIEAYEEGVVGEYQLVPAGVGRMYRIDTITGDAWLSEDGGDWEPIGEADDSSPDDSTSASLPRHLPRSPAHPARAHGARAGSVRGAGLG
jgi:hypothetical protein